MGVFRQNVLVTNANDLAVMRAGYIKESDVRRMEVPFVIDSGAYMMCVNEVIQQQLGLPVVSEHEVKMADGSARLLKMVTGVEVQVFNRRTLTDALVLPGNTEPLFGSIPLEALDVLIDSKEGALRLPPDRPYIAQTLLVSVFR